MSPQVQLVTMTTCFPSPASSCGIHCSHLDQTTSIPLGSVCPHLCPTQSCPHTAARSPAEKAVRSHQSTADCPPVVFHDTLSNSQSLQHIPQHRIWAATSQTSPPTCLHLPTLLWPHRPLPVLEHTSCHHPWPFNFKWQLSPSPQTPAPNPNLTLLHCT